MCGRYARSSDPAKLAREFKVTAAEVPAAQASYNVALTQNVLAVRETPDGREMTFLKWGLVPSWAKDASMGAKLINARSETVAEKPAFRDAFKRRRCIIPADGFYEWKREGSRKQPFFFRLKDERPFGFAGLWERWEGDGWNVLNTCTILTTEANELLRPVHDRMPVILHPDVYSQWLEADERERELLRELLRPYPAGEMLGYPVSPLVNSTRGTGPGLTAEVPLNSA